MCILCKLYALLAKTERERSSCFLYVEILLSNLSKVWTFFPINQISVHVKSENCVEKVSKRTWCVFVYGMYYVSRHSTWECIFIICCFNRSVARTTVIYNRLSPITNGVYCVISELLFSFLAVCDSKNTKNHTVKEQK